MPIRPILYFWLSLVLMMAAASAFAQETFTAADMAVLGIDAATVLYVWSWGFGAVIFFWSLGFAAGAAIRAIRMA